MKTKLRLFLPLLLLALGIAACQEPAKTSDKAQDSLVEGGDSTPARICPQCDSTGPVSPNAQCASDRLVKVGCVDAWLAAWPAQLMAIHVDTADNAQRTFSKSNLDLLRQDCGDCDMRFYFGLDIADGDTSLAMALVNADPNTCDDKYHKGKKVLVHRHTGGAAHQAFLDTTVAIGYVQNWSGLFYPAGQTTYLPIVSYTMSNAAFWRIVDSSSTEITCNLASYTVYGDCADDGLYGMWPEGVDSLTAIDIVVRPNDGPSNSGHRYEDFARPCPNYCNGTRLSNQ